MRRYFSGGFVAAPGIVLLAALATVAGCADGVSEPEAHTGGVATLAAALTAEQCTFFAEGDKVTICRATPSARKPYVIIRTSTEACINAFAGDDASYIAYGDPTCSGLGCFPEGAPCDGSVECCDGLGPIDGYCADIDACASAPCDANATCTDLPAPAPDGPDGRVCACDEGFEGDGEVGGCADIDACATAPCDADFTCIDLPAPAPDGPEGRACACDEGFEGEGEVGVGGPPVTAGLLAHWNARTASSLITTGTKVDRWNDISGNGYDLLPQGGAPSLNATLINGRPGVDFTSAGMRAPGVPLVANASITVFVAMQYRTPGAWGAIVHHGHRDSDWSMEQHGFKSIDITHFQSVNDNTGVELSLAAGTNYVLSGRITGSTRDYSSTSGCVTNSATGTGNSILPSNLNFYVGISDNNERSNAYIGEILYYNRSLSDVERAQVIAYLTKAWGI